MPMRCAGSLRESAQCVASLFGKVQYVAAAVATLLVGNIQLMPLRALQGIVPFLKRAILTNQYKSKIMLVRICKFLRSGSALLSAESSMQGTIWVHRYSFSIM